MIRRLLSRAAPEPQQYRYNAAHHGYYNPLQAVQDAPVTDATVLGIPAAWRCVSLLVDVISSMPINAVVNNKRSKSTPGLLERPNSLETRQETVGGIVYSLAMRGNAYLLLGDFHELANPQQFEVLHPDLVSIDTSGSELLYNVGGQTLTSAELKHIRYLKVPGAAYGLGPVEACRLGLSNIVALEEYGRRSWTEGAVPSSVISVDRNVTPEEAQRIQTGWLAAHGGSSRKPVVLSAGMELQPLSWSPHDAEFLSTKVQAITDAANIFGIPPDRLGAPGSSRTYYNAEQDAIEFLKLTISPWLGRIEAALSDLLPGPVKARFNPDSLLRTSTKDRYQAHKLALDAGWKTPNEVRALEDLPPLEGGDELPLPVPTTAEEDEPPSPEAELKEGLS